MDIGISLSGGGFRASAFHLGVLARLNDGDLLEQIGYISTVSGGSLVVGLIYSANNYSWPSKQAFEEKVVRHVYRMMTTKNLQLGLILGTLLRPVQIFTSRAGAVSRLILENWGIDKSINELPNRPHWFINATCFETGRNWRFETNSHKGTARMGGVHFGYEFSPDYPLSSAMAASAGFPVAIGPISLDTSGRKWEEYVKGGTGFQTREITPKFEKVHLWDGGVYDNLGLEPLDRRGVKRLFVSNSSGKMDGGLRYKAGIGALVRLITIAKYQIEALRSRDTINRFRNENLAGNYFNNGNSSKKILEDALEVRGDDAGYSDSDIPTLSQGYLSPADAEKASTIPTEIDKMAPEEFKLLFRHGYEVADCTMFAYGEEEDRQLMRYDSDKWEALYV